MHPRELGRRSQDPADAFRDLRRSCRACLVSALVSFAIVFCIAGGKTVITHREFEASGRFVLPGFRKADADDRINRPWLGDPRYVRTECEILRTSAILEGALDRLRMTDLVQGDSVRDGDTEIAQQVAKLRSRFEVKPVDDDGVVELSVKGRHPEEAVLCLTNILRTYLDREGPVRGLSDTGVERATPVKVEPVAKLPALARDALAAGLLSIACGNLVSFGLRGSARQRARTEILPRVFLMVFCLVWGGVSLVDSSNLAVGAAAGLFWGFVLAAIAQWTVVLRRNFPYTPKLFLVVFLCWVLFAMANHFLSGFLVPKVYSSTTIVRLHPKRAVGEAVEELLREPVRLDPGLLRKEIEWIYSDSVLGQVIDRLGLRGTWRPAIPGSFPPDRFRQSFAHFIDFNLIPGTFLAAVRVHGEDPDQVARVANKLAEIYGDSRNATVAEARTEGVYEVVIVDRARPATDPESRFGAWVFGAASWAIMTGCVLVGGAVFGAWLTSTAAGKLRAILIPLLLVTFPTALCLVPFFPPRLRLPLTIPIFMAAGFLGASFIGYLTTKFAIRKPTDAWGKAFIAHRRPGVEPASGSGP